MESQTLKEGPGRDVRRASRAGRGQKCSQTLLGARMKCPTPAVIKGKEKERKNFKQTMLIFLNMSISTLKFQRFFGTVISTDELTYRK